MTNKSRNNKRTLAKKITSFVLYVDQVTQIQAIIESTGGEKAAQVFRDLIDEALAARRRKTAQQLVLPEEVPSVRLDEMLETIQTLLLKLIEQGEKARCVRGISLELLQEVLAASCADRFGLWETLAMPALIEQGKTPHEISRLFDAQTAKGKSIAYGTATEIKDELYSSASQSETLTIDENESEIATAAAPAAG